MQGGGAARQVIAAPGDAGQPAREGAPRGAPGLGGGLGERERKAGCYLSKIANTFQEAIKSACSCQMNAERALISILAGNDPFPS